MAENMAKKMAQKVDSHDHLIAPLEETLRRAGLADPAVTISGVPSVGATRSTLLIDIESGGEHLYAVAQIGPMTDDTPVAPSCLLYTSPSPRDATLSRMPSSA